MSVLLYRVYKSLNVHFGNKCIIIIYIVNDNIYLKL